MRNVNSTLLGFNLLFASTLLLLAGCSSYNPNIGHGPAGYRLKPDAPRMSLDAVGFINLQGNPTLGIGANILRNSLIYTDSTGTPQAKLTMKLYIQSLSDSTISQALTISRKPGADIYHYYREVQVPAGDYKIRATLTDQSSGKEISNTARATLAKPTSGSIGLGNVRMQTKDGKWRPQVGYNIPGKVDSLQFSIRVKNDSAGPPLNMHARLIKFKADTSASDAISGPRYVRYSLPFLGINYKDSTVVHKKQRTIFQTTPIEVQFRFKRPQPGNYRLEVRSQKGSKTLFKARDFAVKSNNFPAVRSPHELARPLIYLMRYQDSKRNEELLNSTHFKAIMRLSDTDSLKWALNNFMKSDYWRKKATNKYKAMITITDPGSLQAAVDHFWLGLTNGDAKKANRLQNLYYRRVEEANKKFTTYKEGWKTGPGMIYILYGPPNRIHHYVPEMAYSPDSDTSTFGMNRYSLAADMMGWTFKGRIAYLNETIESPTGPASTAHPLAKYDISRDDFGDFQTHLPNIGDGLFYFYQHQPKSKDYPFNQVLLVRPKTYNFIIRRRVVKQLKRWMSGEILE